MQSVTERIVTGLMQGRDRTPTSMVKGIATSLAVIKISGKICQKENLARLAGEIRELTEKGYKVILIHGGGKQIDEALAAKSIPTVKKRGLRVTQKEAISTIEETLTQINGEIATAMKSAGLSIAAIDGIRTGVTYGRTMEGFDRTGVVAAIDKNLLNAILSKTRVVVVSCLGKDENGSLNINADDVARAIGVELKASMIVLLSDVPGVLRNSEDLDTLIKRIYPEDVPALIETGVLKDGMIRKVNECMHAIKKGVDAVMIANGNGPELSLSKLVENGVGAGTVFVSKGNENGW